MSKTIPINLAAHYALASTTLAHALKITRTDGQVFAFTSADADVTLSSVLHRSAPGLNVTSIALSAGFAVDNLELAAGRRLHHPRRGAGRRVAQRQIHAGQRQPARPG